MRLRGKTEVTGTPRPNEDQKVRKFFKEFDIHKHLFMYSNAEFFEWL